MGVLREREQEPRCRTIQSQAERRDRGQTEESWLLFEGIDTFVYDLMRKSKKSMCTCVSKSKSKSCVYIFLSSRTPGINVIGFFNPQRRGPTTMDDDTALGSIQHRGQSGAQLLKGRGPLERFGLDYP